MLRELRVHHIEVFIPDLEMQVGRADPGVPDVGDDFPLPNRKLLGPALNVDGVAFRAALFLFWRGR